MEKKTPRLERERDRVFPENESGPETVVPTTCPAALVERSWLVSDVMAAFVEVAVPLTVSPVAAVPPPIVELAYTPIPSVVVGESAPEATLQSRYKAW